MEFHVSVFPNSRVIEAGALSWQIIPKTLGRLLFDKDPAKAQRVLQAMLQMEQIVFSVLLARVCPLIGGCEQWDGARALELVAAWSRTALEQGFGGWHRPC